MDKTAPWRDLPASSRVTGDAWQRRRQAGLSLINRADAIVLACQAMARRFQRGGRLIAFGNGASSTDAQHIAVEFVHPVIVGKRALPAIALPNDSATLSSIATRHHWHEVFAYQLGYLACPEDIAIGLSLDGQCHNVYRGLQRARDMGMLTLALVGGDRGVISSSAVAEHLLAVPAADPLVVKEMHVTCYHMLWELVHVFLAHAGLPEPGGESMSAAGGLEALYPSLYARPGELSTVLQAARRSTVAKIQEIVALREQVADELGPHLRACAGAMAQALRAHGRIWVFGNGGSATDAQALTQLFLAPPAGQPLPATALTHDVAVVTALANDVGFEVVFARQIAAFGKAGDIAIGLSTSGNSANVMRGFDEAARRRLLTVGFAGYDGGQMAAAAAVEYVFVVPAASVHRIQEAQTTLYHVLWELTQEALQETAGREMS